jgi:hypothetical protein
MNDVILDPGEYTLTEDENGIKIEYMNGASSKFNAAGWPYVPGLAVEVQFLPAGRVKISRSEKPYLN